MIKDIQFTNMRDAAVARLRGRDPFDISCKTGIPFDGTSFHVESFGNLVTITRDFCITPTLEMWQHLTILQYMDVADGTPLAPENDLALSSFREGGLVRGSSFDRQLNEQFAADRLAETDIRKAAIALGGVEIDGRADLTFQFSFMPRFPMVANIWLEDEEFPASVKVLYNRNAEHYLKVEAAGALAELLVGDIIRIDRGHVV